MELLSQSRASTQLGLGSCTLPKWQELGLIPAQPVPGKSYLGYPVDYVQGLAKATGNYPLTRLFAELYWLQYSYDSGASQKRTRVMQRLLELQTDGKVIGSAQAAEQLGFHLVTTQHRCRTGDLRCVKINRRLFLPTKDVQRHARILAGLTATEAAEILGVDRTSINDWFRQGKLPGLRAINGENRFEERTLLQYKAEYLTAPGTPLLQRQVAEILGVTGGSIRAWTHQGLLCAMQIGSTSLYDAAEVARLRLELDTLNAGFEWLQNMSKRRSSTINASQVSRMLSCSLGSLCHWTQTGLLPFYYRTPGTAARFYIRDYHKLYVFGLKRHAAGRPVRQQLLIEYRGLCTAAQQVV
jgi:predicted site-specific integrase-resolvase